MEPKKSATQRYQEFFGDEGLGVVEEIVTLSDEPKPLTKKTTGRLPIKQGFWRPGAPGGSCRPSPMWKALAHMHRAHRLAWVQEHLRRDLTPAEREMVQLMNRSQRRAFVAAQNRRGA